MVAVFGDHHQDERHEGEHGDTHEYFAEAQQGAEGSKEPAAVPARRLPPTRVLAGAGMTTAESPTPADGASLVAGRVGHRVVVVRARDERSTFVFVVIAVVYVFAIGAACHLIRKQSRVGCAHLSNRINARHGRELGRCSVVCGTSFLRVLLIANHRIVPERMTAGRYRATHVSKETKTSGRAIARDLDWRRVTQRALTGLVLDDSDSLARTGLKG
jgi:hypothetical protein